jgi:hypothetical protein
LALLVVVQFWCALATLPWVLKVLTSTGSPVEQSVLLARLLDAGIPCMRGAGRQRSVLDSGRDVLVEEEDFARAREVLNEDDEGFDEEELARLSEEAISPRRSRYDLGVSRDTTGVPLLVPSASE